MHTGGSVSLAQPCAREMAGARRNNRKHSKTEVKPAEKDGLYFFFIGLKVTGSNYPGMEDEDRKGPGYRE